MTKKRIIALCLALVVLVGGLAIPATGILKSHNKENKTSDGGKPLPAVLSELMGLFRPEANIKSDGRLYPLNTINVVPIVTEIPKGERLPVVGDRETLLKLLKDRGALYDNSERNLRGNNNWGIMADGYAIDEAVDMLPAPAATSEPQMEAPSMDSAQVVEKGYTSGDGSGGSYSETNEQTEGVSEGDIVKTDGHYIYAMSQSYSTLRIIKADGAKLEVVSTIPFTDMWGVEFYLIGNDRLAIVGSEYVPPEDIQFEGGAEPPDSNDRIMPYYYGWYSNSFTVLEIYDISAREDPSLLRRVSMDGNSISTRVIGDIVYLVTNKQIWNIPYNQADSPSILPYCRDTLEGEGFEPISFDDIYYIPDSLDSNYLLIGAIDVYDDGAEFKPEAYLGAGSNFYMSKNAIYITIYRWDQLSKVRGPVDVAPIVTERTDILRFAVSGTDVTYTGMGTVDGSPINQYSMDEYKDYFRIATTNWETGTYVTVLKTSNMKTVGRTEPLAPGERMQSMRFVGDMGYVVTFQNMDPLFTIDLSDPYNPKVLGELKIPGFSQYLHPVGGGLMLGIGRDVQVTYTRDVTGVERIVGTTDVGLKASLFDVSNPFDPKEIGTLALGEGWTEVCDNPRALMCDASRGLYGFMMQIWDNRGSQSSDALILCVDDGKLTIDATLKLDKDFWVYNSRLCFIGNSLYLVHDTGIVVYDYSSYVMQGSISF